MTKKKTPKQFIEDLERETGGTIIALEEYTLAKNPLLFKCTICGHEFKTSAAHVIGKHKTGCPECAKQRVASSQRLDRDQISENIKKIGNNEYEIVDWLNYKTTADDIKLKHITCGHEFIMSYNNFRNGQRCPLHRWDNCKEFQFTKKSHEYYIELIEKNCYDFNDYEFLEKFNGRYTKVKVRHKICGHEYEVCPGKFLDGRRCPECASNINSNSTKLIATILKDNGINYITEKTFDDLKNPKTGYPLRYDFYIPEFNAIIEYDGEFHDKILNRNSKEKMLETQYRDTLKNKYCEDKNIYLLRIHYSNKLEIPNIIKEFINKFK